MAWVLIAFGASMAAVVSLMVFKERSMTVRDGVLLVAVTEIVIYGLVVPHAVNGLGLIICSVVMWSIITRHLSVSISRRLKARLSQHDAHRLK